MVVSAWLWALLWTWAQGEILTPPYFNLAAKKKILATATCGVDTEGPELYCKLVGANAENDIDVNLIQGQVSFAKIIANRAKMFVLFQID